MKIEKEFWIRGGDRPGRGWGLGDIAQALNERFGDPTLPVIRGGELSEKRLSWHISGSRSDASGQRRHQVARLSVEIEEKNVPDIPFLTYRYFLHGRTTQDGKDARSDLRFRLAAVHAPESHPPRHVADRAFELAGTK